jgi:hypothetical protein
LSCGRKGAMLPPAYRKYNKGNIQRGLVNSRSRYIRIFLSVIFFVLISAAVFLVAFMLTVYQLRTLYKS